MGDEYLPKRSPYKNQSLVMINDKGIYQIKYSIRNSFDKYQRLVVINGIYHVRYNVRNNLDKPKKIQS